MRQTPSADASSPNARPLLALILGQVCLHSCMAGVRVAAPLLALKAGHEPWAIGLLLGLFAAAPVLLSLRAGRLADKHGYHRPLRIAVALTCFGGLLAVISAWLTTWQFPLLCIAAPLCGVGTNLGLITIQRTASRLAAGDRNEVTRIFSWLGLAPAISNVIGPMVTGFMIDLAGFRSAFVVLTLMPLAALWCARQVPVEVRAAAAGASPKKRVWDLLDAPGMRRLLLVGWLTSSSWDLHSFLVPILGHERGFSASAIGLILAGFSACVAAVRVFIPFLSHRLRQSQVVAGSMVITALVFTAYPWVSSAWLMALCAGVLGMALGAVNPMIMTALHDLTPEGRHGEAIALRSMSVNSSSAVMPFVFGIAGTAVGAGALFWVMGAALGAGSFQARHLTRY
jgi:MFS family permease